LNFVGKKVLGFQDKESHNHQKSNPRNDATLLGSLQKVDWYLAIHVETGETSVLHFCLVADYKREWNQSRGMLQSLGRLWKSKKGEGGLPEEEWCGLCWCNERSLSTSQPETFFHANTFWRWHWRDGMWNFQIFDAGIGPPKIDDQRAAERSLALLLPLLFLLSHQKHTFIMSMVYGKCIARVGMFFCSDSSRFSPTTLKQNTHR
jgi:hypothetical protein